MRLITIFTHQLSGIHPKLSSKSKQISSLMYTAQVRDFTAEGLASLLKLYPIHVMRRQDVDYPPGVPPSEDKQLYYVVAGLRQFELLSVFLALQATSTSQSAESSVQNTVNQVFEQIQVIEQTDLRPKQILELAGDDIAGSAVLFSLGTKVAAQLDIIRQHTGSAVLDKYPKYSSERRLADRAKVSD
ncbi:hypothetical protein ACFO3I_03265 [Rheinheimera marina]|uniref:Uncharacterized protein n=1 Tax=Rheinheimera marina TaxID=1774958 RepID=A0ABV9JHQ0_9GAMM